MPVRAFEAFASAASARKSFGAAFRCFFPGASTTPPLRPLLMAGGAERVARALLAVGVAPAWFRFGQGARNGGFHLLQQLAGAVAHVRDLLVESVADRASPRFLPARCRQRVQVVQQTPPLAAPVHRPMPPYRYSGSPLSPPCCSVCCRYRASPCELHVGGVESPVESTAGFVPPTTNACAPRPCVRNKRCVQRTDISRGDAQSIRQSELKITGVLSPVRYQPTRSIESPVRFDPLSW